jgi:hypothetical protein
MSFHRFLQEFKGCIPISALGGVAFQHLAFMIMVIRQFKEASPPGVKSAAAAVVAKAARQVVTVAKKRKSMELSFSERRGTIPQIEATENL